MSDFDGSETNEEISDSEADELLDRLGLALEDVETVPPWLTRFAYESHRLVGMEGELAEIAADSFVSSEPGSRSTGGLRTVEFATDGVSLQLEIAENQIRGSVAPAEATLELVSSDFAEPIGANSRGFFSLSSPEGPFRFVIRVADRVIRTDWITLR